MLKGAERGRNLVKDTLLKQIGESNKKPSVQQSE
jgi:hypothetical protein